MRTYEVRTYGCQMNVHDSERLTGLLEEAGYVAAAGGERGRRRRLQHLRGAGERRQQALRQPRPPRAGQGRRARACRSRSAAAWRRRTAATITRKAPWVDVVFGTHNIGSLPVLLERARVQERGAGRDPRVARGLPVDAADAPRVGVRRLGLGLASAATTPARSASSRACAARRRTAGPATSSPRSERWSARASSRSRCSGRTSTPTASSSATGRPFGKLLRACGDVDGLERVRFTSPHPADFTDDVIEAMAETPNVMPQLHMPLQSGSDRVLKAMRRSYRQEQYLGIIDRVRAAMPDAAITTDIIVGFPGETEDDFEQTLEVVRAGAVRRRVHLPVLPAARHARRDDARPGARRRSCRSATSGSSRCVDEIAWAENQALVGRAGRGAGRRGRGPQGRRDAPALRPGPGQPARALRRPPDAERPRPGDVVDVESPTPPRTTWSPTARRRYACGVPAPATPGRRGRPRRPADAGRVLLGMPARRPPARDRAR